MELALKSCMEECELAMFIKEEILLQEAQGTKPFSVEQLFRENNLTTNFRYGLENVCSAIAHAAFSAPIGEVVYFKIANVLRLVVRTSLSRSTQGQDVQEAYAFIDPDTGYDDHTKAKTDDIIKRTTQQLASLA